MDASADLSFLENYKAVKARLNNPPRAKELVYREVKKLPTLDDVVAKYRLAFDGGAPKPLRPSAMQIMREVCQAHRVPRLAIMSGRRSPQIVNCKHEIMWRVYHETSLSYPQIGAILGGMDHTSCMHGVRRHQARIDAGGAPGVGLARERAEVGP